MGYQLEREGRGFRLKLDVQGQRGRRILDVTGQGVCVCVCVGGGGERDGGIEN